MKLNLDLNIPKPGFEIGHQQKITLLGSCFAENIGKRLHELKFDTHLNPNGILFNPISIANALKLSLLNQPIDDGTLIERDGLWFSFYHHSSIYACTKQELKNRIQTIRDELRTSLLQSEILIITFGSAHVYQLNDPGLIVANCHKQDSARFSKKLISIDEIVNEFSGLIQEIHSLNPTIKVIFTVSPVKYLKDGIHQNNLSKSTLLLGIEELLSLNNTYYFPAFELVNDDLRDYRFYKPDMAHPNEQAIEYVWGKFSDTFFSEETIALNKSIREIVLAENHTLLHPESESARKFSADIESKKQRLAKQFPFIRF